MGYTSAYSWQSKADVIKDTVSSFERSGYVFVEKRSPANYFTALVQAPDGRKFILVVRIERRNRQWFEKTMDHTVGPNFHDIPVHWLDAVDTSGEFAKEWAVNVRNYKGNKQAKHAAALEKRSLLRIGAKVTLPEGYSVRNFTVTDILPRKVFAVSNTGRRYRIPASALVNAVIQ